MTTIARVQTFAVLLTLFLLAASAIGYLVVPASMLSVVGIAGTPITEFLVRTLAAAFVGMLPAVWALRRRTESPLERSVLFGLALYMAVGSVVDLVAFLSGVVGMAAVPSIALRLVLGATLGGLAIYRGQRR